MESVLKQRMARVMFEGALFALRNQYPSYTIKPIDINNLDMTVKMQSFDRVEYLKIKVSEPQ